MQLVKLIVEASDHVLNLGALLLSLQPFNHGLLDLLRAHMRVCGGEHPVDVLLAQHVIDRRVLVLIEQRQETLIDQLQGLLVQGRGTGLRRDVVEVAPGGETR